MKKLTLSLTTLTPILSCLYMASTSLCAQTLTYTYDVLGRVTFVEDATNGNRDYDYDAAGNRVAVNLGSATDESSTPPVLTAPTAPTCQAVGGGSTWFATWNAVPGAHHYQFRNINEQEFTVTTNNSGSASRCKWVKACNANNVCSEQTLF